MCKKLAGFVILLFLVNAEAWAQAPVALKREGDMAKWTVDDVLQSETADDFQIAPDGRHVIWVKHTPDKNKGTHVGHLIRSSLTEKQEVQLTRGSESCTAPRWSPDGKLVAFLSARPNPKAKEADDSDKRKAADKDKEPKTQLWLLDAFGGEPWPLTEGQRAVVCHDWADPDTVIFAAQEDPTLFESTLKDEKKDPTVVVDDEQHEPPVRLFRVSVKEKKVTRLTDNPDRVKSFTVSPDGHWVVAIHERSLRYVFDHKVKPALFLHDLESGQRRQLFAERRFNVDEVRWQRDSKGFYASSDFTSHPHFVNATITELYHYELASDATSKVNLDWDNGLAEPLVAVAEDGFVGLLAEGVRNRAACYRRAGSEWKRQDIVGEHARQLFGVKLGKDGQALVYKHSTASTPEQWYRARLRDGRIEGQAQLTELNAHLQSKAKARVEIIRWKGALDEEVEGILHYPHDYQPNKRYPLVLSIHGGPAAADFDAWREYWARAPNLLCQRGAFVLRPNYHGSTNYGLKWAESIANGKYYEYPIQDIEKGVDSLIERGLVDPDKLGTMGWSNGAILSIALIVHNQRYQAAVAGAGGAEWVADWGACEFGMSFSNYYFGKSPLEDPQLYIKMAPLYQFAKVRTPTLLFHGTEDRDVPAHHGWTQYRALQQHSSAETRLVLFPGEKHGLEKLAHQRRKLEEELAWFDRHLFKTTREAEPAYKPESPLAWALQLQKARRDGKRYGVMVQDRLVPETVLYEELSIGRFEVTRAQYAAFDSSYHVQPGEENQPANGIRFEQARAYCDWLSKLAGEVYRLPNETEVAALYEKPDTRENTLDYWAGHAVNPDDAGQLREQLKKLNGPAPLVRPVGSFKGVGKEEMVFDLGGNVAEWAIGKDGQGRPLGGSADQPADAKLNQRHPAPEYIGFRVVKGARK